MANFILSAFADEIDPNFEEQLKGLKKLDIPYVELRGVNGKSFTLLTDDEVLDVRDLLARYGIKVWSLGSPIGKIHTNDDFEAHKHLLTHIMDIGDMLDVKRIRMFSFYPPEGAKPEDWRDEVFRRLEIMLEDAEKAGVKLVHENEKGIYGDVNDRCVELMEKFYPRMGFVFDPANFVQCGMNTLEGYEKLHKYITYMHIKDAFLSDGAVVAAGHGDGHVAEILKKLNAERDDDVILTVEPHLRVFKGLSELQGEAVTHHEQYPDSRTAFHAACTAIKEILAAL